jgi:hypothetical protein
MSAQPAIALVRKFAPRSAVMTEVPEVVKAAQTVLKQGLDLLIQLDNTRYSVVAREPFRASVGQHYRHVVEHFQAVTWGIRSGEINYDARARNQRIENEVSYASVVTCEVLRALNRLTHGDLAERCDVVASVGYGFSAPFRLQSNFGREVADCTAHAIHHYAIIRLVCAEMGVAIPDEFGYSPATLKHLAGRAAD